MTLTNFVLKRSFQPYAGLTTILSFVTILGVVISFQTHDWTLIGALPFGWLMFAPYVYIGTRYRIFWHNGKIIQKASGMEDVTIKANEILKIEKETSNLSTFISLRRPFRRITIYGKDADGEKYIDVSLKHFALEDICKLLKEIHDERPDLKIPQV